MQSIMHVYKLSSDCFLSFLETSGSYIRSFTHSINMAGPRRWPGHWHFGRLWHIRFRRWWWGLTAWECTHARFFRFFLRPFAKAVVAIVFIELVINDRLFTGAKPTLEVFFVTSLGATQVLARVPFVPLARGHAYPSLRTCMWHTISVCTRKLY